MTIREMHYDFKQKLNVIDSKKYTGLVVPEIDWKLNEAQELFIKMVAEPRLQSQLGFEINQRTIDDLRTIVVNQHGGSAQPLVTFDASESTYFTTLPTDYMFYVGSTCYADKDDCANVPLQVYVIQHDDQSEVSPFDKSSFFWRIANIRFIKEGIKVFTGGDFVPSILVMNYLKRPVTMHNAADYVNGTYNTLGGVALTGTVNCELPEQVHREIVDLAVFITSGDLNLNSYGIKQNKVKLNN